MTSSGTCLMRRLGVLAIVASLPSACGTAGSERTALTVCPPVGEYGSEMQMRAAAELELLPEGSAVEALLADYAVLREQARACPTDVRPHSTG
jgi:hypothetical protein